MTLIKAAFCAGSWLRMQRFTVPCPHRALFSFASRERRSFLFQNLGVIPGQQLRIQRASVLRGSSLYTHNFSLILALNSIQIISLSPLAALMVGRVTLLQQKAAPRGWLLGCSLPALHFQMRSHKPPKKTKQLLISGQRGAGGWQEATLGLWENPAFGLCHGSCWLLFPPCHILSLQDVTSLLFPTFSHFLKNFNSSFCTPGSHSLWFR